MVVNNKLVVLLFCIATGQVVFGQDTDTTVVTTDSVVETFELSPDDEVLRMIDQSFAEVYAKTFMNRPYVLPDEPRDTLLLSRAMDEQEIAARMKELNRNTPFELVYNQYVQAFITLYVVRKRDVTERILGLAPHYYPLFEAELAKNNLPLELKYLPIVESALNPRAKSRAGALGLWQFMYHTGRMYGLSTNSYYDERMDPAKSTVAACQYLKALYKVYNDWNLVIAAYNCGPGNVNKAIRRSGGKRDFWEIRSWLPRETRGYVPAFMAVNYAMNHAGEHGLLAMQPPVELYATDTIHVCNKLSFETVSKTLEISEDWLKYFNPMYSLDIIPESKERLAICLPQDKVGAFLLNEDSIYAFHRRREQQIEQKQPSEKPLAQGHEIIHRVRSGEVLGVIAQKYNCKVADIREWNRLSSSNIYPGQQLKIYTNRKPSTGHVAEKPAPQTTQKSSPAHVIGKYEYYTVQPGDTLWDIAKKYKEVTVNDLKRWNSDLDFKKLKPGDKIKVSKVG